MALRLMTLATAFALVCAGTPSEAAFDSAQAKCRAALAKTGTKHGSTIVKTLAGCHKSRNGDKIPAGTDCTTVNNDSDAKGKVTKTATKLADSVGEGPKSKCAGIDPAALGLTFCPAPCDGAVPSITDMDDVAACSECLVRAHATAVVANTMGNPASPPLSKIDGKCHASIGKAAGKLYGTILKERIKCQSGQEKEGAMDTTGCSGITNAKIDGARVKSSDAVAKSCSGADFNAIDSCEGASLTNLQLCVVEFANSLGEQTFISVAGPPAPTVSWATDIQPLFAAQCSSGFCHTGGNDAGVGLGNLDDCDLGYATLVGQASTCFGTSSTTRVVPGDPTSSFLMHKLDGTQDCASRMPLGFPQLSLSDRNDIRRWIQTGAAQDCP